jgi:hypothetical protein
MPYFHPHNNKVVSIPIITPENLHHSSYPLNYSPFNLGESLLQTFFSLIVIVTIILIFASLKVLLRTNPALGLGIIAGCLLLLVLCWFIYPKINKS